MIIVVSYALVAEENVKNHHPKVAIMDENNHIVEMLRTEPASTVR